jgi:hypothetical protein
MIRPISIIARGFQEHEYTKRNKHQTGLVYKECVMQGKVTRQIVFFGMQKTVLALFLLILAACGGGSSNNPDAASKENVSHRYWAGEIDTSMHIMMHLQQEEGKTSVNGTYYYCSIRKEIQLSGNMDQKTMQLDESNNGKITGTFLGEINKDSIIGNWESPDGKSFPLRLGKSSEEEYQSFKTQKTLADVKDKKLNKFLKQFATKESKYTLDNYNEETAALLDTNDVKQYLQWNYDEEGWMKSAFHPIAAMYYDRFILLVVIREWTPGAFGIFNNFIEGYTIDYTGKKISSAAIGCYCNDSDMGINEFHHSEDIIHFSFGKITANHHYYHETLFEEELEEGQEAWSIHEENTTFFQIDLNGGIFFSRP